MALIGFIPVATVKGGKIIRLCNHNGDFARNRQMRRKLTLQAAQ
jgi:hypothetical protein